MSGTKAGVALLSRKKRASVCILSAGGTLNPTSREEFKRLGGDIFDNCRAVSSVMGENRVQAVVTDNDIRVEASAFVLSTGKFFSRGLVSDMDGVYEPVFGADVEFEADRSAWSSEDFFDPQPFESFGVRTEGSRVLKDGNVIENLYACGEILCGVVDVDKSVREVCRNIR